MYVILSIIFPSNVKSTNDADTVYAVPDSHGHDIKFSDIRPNY